MSSRPGKRPCSEVAPSNVLSLCTFLKQIRIADEALEALFTEVVGRMPARVPNVEAILDVLLRIKASDAQLREVRFQYQFALDTRANCSAELAAVEREERRNLQKRAALAKELNRLLEEDARA